MHRPSHASPEGDSRQMVAILSVVLVLISIGTIVGPVGAVVIIYNNDLTQLVITPQIRDIVNGNSTIFPAFGHSDNEGSGDNGDLDLSGLMTPVFVSVQIDEAEHTFTGIFSLTNSLNYDLTLNSLNADVQITQSNVQAGSINLGNPVTVVAGETSQITITGTWTQQAIDYITTNYPGATSINVSLTNITIDINGITIQDAGPIDAGSIPLTIQG
jgi:hypothetical protein